MRLYFRIIDPLSINRQGEDEGTRYRRVEKKLGCELAVELRHLISFYKAEEYHQDYLDKTPGGYCHLSPEMFKLAIRYKKKSNLSTKLP